MHVFRVLVLVLRERWGRFGRVGVKFEVAVAVGLAAAPAFALL